MVSGACSPNTQEAEAGILSSRPHSATLNNNKTTSMTVGGFEPSLWGGNRLTLTCLWSRLVWDYSLVFKKYIELFLGDIYVVCICCIYLNVCMGVLVRARTALVPMRVPEVNPWCLPWLLPILFSEITVSHWTWSPSIWLDCQSIECALLYSVHLPSLEFKCMPLLYPAKMESRLHAVQSEAYQQPHVPPFVWDDLLCDT